MLARVAMSLMLDLTLKTEMEPSFVLAAEPGTIKPSHVYSNRTQDATADQALTLDSPARRTRDDT